MIEGDDVPGAVATRVVEDGHAAQAGGVADAHEGSDAGAVLHGARLEDLRRREVRRGRVADVDAERVDGLLGALRQVARLVREEAAQVEDHRVALRPEHDVAVDGRCRRREEDVRVVARRPVIGGVHEREGLVRGHVVNRVGRQAPDPDAVRHRARNGHVARDRGLRRAVVGERAAVGMARVGEQLGTRRERRVRRRDVEAGHLGQVRRVDAALDRMGRRRQGGRHVLRGAAEAVERQAVHVRLQHDLLVDLGVVRGLTVVPVQRAHPLLADGAARVEVAREVAHQPLGEVGDVGVAVAEAGVCHVDRRPRAHVGLGPVLEPLLRVRIERRHVVRP